MIDDLVEKLKHKAGNVRYDAIEELEKSGETALPALITSLKHEDRFTRIFAASALGKIGPLAKEAVPALVAAPEDWMIR